MAEIAAFEGIFGLASLADITVCMLSTGLVRMSSSSACIMAMPDLSSYGKDGEGGD